MTFETALPPEQRHFDPHCGWINCPHCKGLIQTPLYDENNEYYEDSNATELKYNAHNEICTSENPYIDPNFYYPDPNDLNDPELKCYYESCNY